MHEKWKVLNRKMRPQYSGLLIVIARNRGGAYILAELDGSVFDRPIAAFRVIPYFAPTKITLPPLQQLLDISTKHLEEMKNTIIADPDEQIADEDMPQEDD